MHAMHAPANGTAMDLNSLSAAQLRWLAACIASMPQQPQEQLPMQLAGMAPGTAPLQDRSLSDSTMADDDPIRADLSHGIMPSGRLLEAGQNYFNPTQMAQANPVCHSLSLPLPVCTFCSI